MIRSYFRRPVGPGWALVGDGAYQKDPGTAQGITDALSPRRAARRRHRRRTQRVYQQAQKLLAQRKLIDEAAMWLREAATRDGYAGFRRSEVAFAMA
jgi:hypothetical protein